MKEFRRSIAAQPGPFLEMIRTVEDAVGQPVTAEMYKHPEKWENPELERFYYWKAKICCDRHEDFSEATFSPELSTRVREFFTQLMPLYEYFNRFKV
jgi:spore coat polysaccharide biosynthesis protein SpsF (cytidylyltransferase family)